jgi:hypothetical protein
VEETDAYAGYRQRLGDPAWMRDHERLRERIFPPTREARHHEDRFAGAGFELREVTRRAITVDREEWSRFLEVYHAGVLGWVGGAEKVTGEPVDEPVVDDRRALIREALARVLDGAGTFEAEWTYWRLGPA